MQEKNHSKVKYILLTLANHANVKGIRGFARFLGLNESALYAWINREKIADTGSILSKMPGLNPEWLETGEGEMFVKNKFQQFADEIDKNSVKLDQLDYDGQKEGPENGAEVISILGHLTRMGDKAEREKTIKELSEFAAKKLAELAARKKT